MTAPIDTNTQRPMRRCQECGTDFFHRIVVGNCKTCNHWVAYCKPCGGGDRVQTELREHRREHRKPKP
jgi:hypothetical protein